MRRKVLESDALARSYRLVNRFDEFDGLVTVIGRDDGWRAVQDGADERRVLGDEAFSRVVVEHMKGMCCVVGVCASAVKEPEHFLGDNRPVVTENLDALEGKHPAGIGGRGKGAVKAIPEPEDDGKLIDLGILMS